MNNTLLTNTILLKNDKYQKNIIFQIFSNAFQNNIQGKKKKINIIKCAQKKKKSKGPFGNFYFQLFIRLVLKSQYPSESHRLRPLVVRRRGEFL